ncbi:hypothetical protein NicSoilB8_34690 [Arthrobacter sp. NicSoilB8]|nr:hypothetical protein NicSoilB8_34690 [Arthrobacter sp. NicSoilB8]
MVRDGVPDGAGRSVVELQRSAGNRAVTHLLGRNGVERRHGLALQRQTEHIRTSDEVQQVASFAGVPDAERVRLFGIVLDQVWVGPRDEAALVRLWGSLDEDGLVRFADAHPELWHQCISRGADLLDLPRYRAIQDRFRADVLALARQHLDNNERLIRGELAALGPPEEAPGMAAADRVAALQAAAASLSNLQRAQEAARQARVGWRLGDGGEVDADFVGREVKFQMPFRPGEPPPLTQEPEDVPNGDIFVQPVVPFADVQARYDAAAQAIAYSTSASPGLVGLIRAGSSAATEAFVTDADPASARDRLLAPLRGVLTDIGSTRANLGGRLNALDLTPLHDQLFEGTAGGGVAWSTGFRRDVVRSMVVGHNIERAAARLALREVQHLALLFAPFTSGASLLLLLGGATAAAGLQAYLSHREAGVVAAAEGSAVEPGTALVRPGSAEFARMTTENDTIAFGLALLTLGAAGFQVWRAGAEARALSARARAFVREAQAAGRPAVINIGGAGAPHEPAGAINLNPQVPGTERVGIPNLVQAQGERIGELFPASSADGIVGYRLPPHDVIDWNRVAPGAARVLRPGARLTISFQGASDAAETLGAALRRNGFREVTVTSGVLVEAVR